MLSPNGGSVVLPIMENKYEKDKFFSFNCGMSRAF